MGGWCKPSSIDIIRIRYLTVGEYKYVVGTGHLPTSNDKARTLVILVFPSLQDLENCRFEIDTGLYSGALRYVSSLHL